MILVPILWLLVPESPRFLALSQNHAAALDVANWLSSKMNSMLHYELTVEDLQRTCPAKAELSISPEFAVGTSGVLGMIRMALVDFTISASKLYTSRLRPTTWPLQMVWFSDLI